MTEKLYYIDSYKTEFDAVVVSCEKNKKGFATVLDKTAFYPEGGGQPRDKGILTYAVKSGENITVNVKDVKEKDDIIIHYTDSALPVGESVHGLIDWDRRYSLMQQHTGDHILSGVVLKEFGLNNVGFHLSDNDMMIDYDGRLSRRDIEKVVRIANDYALRAQPVTASFPDNVENLHYRSKIHGIVGKIRIVQAGDADICACCGTHTRTTAEASPIILTDFAYMGQNTRLFVKCGKRALDYANDRNRDCLAISRMLSLPVEKIADGVKKRLADIENYKSQLGEVKKQLLDIRILQTKTAEGVAVLAKDGLDSADVQKAALALGEKSDVAVVLSGGGTNKIAIASSKIDTNKLGKFIRGKLGGKGGGKIGIYQGFSEKKRSEEQLHRLVLEFLRTQN
jgi:alanyl-tRNA synthetase